MGVHESIERGNVMGSFSIKHLFMFLSSTICASRPYQCLSGKFFIENPLPCHIYVEILRLPR